MSISRHPVRGVHMLNDLRQAFPSPAYATITRTDLRDDDLATAEDISRMTGMTTRWVYETFPFQPRAASGR